MRPDGLLTALVLGGTLMGTLASAPALAQSSMANPCNPCNPCAAGMMQQAAPEKSNSTHPMAPMKAVHLNKPIVAVIEADWCPSCRHIKPTLMSLMKKYGKEAQFVMLDVTNPRAKEASERLAKAYGLTAFYRENQSKTSTVGIFAAHAKAPSKILVGEADEAPYVEALEAVEKR